LSFNIIYHYKSWGVRLSSRENVTFNATLARASAKLAVAQHLPPLAWATATLAHASQGGIENDILNGQIMVDKGQLVRHASKGGVENDILNGQIACMVT
jgi:hypothetical protein